MEQPRVGSDDDQQKIIDHLTEQLAQVNKRLESVLSHNERLQNNLDALVRGGFDPKNVSESSSSEDEMEIADSASESNDSVVTLKEGLADATAGSSAIKTPMNTAPKQQAVSKDAPRSSKVSTKAVKKTNEAMTKSKSVPVVTTYNINVKYISTKLENLLGHKDYNIKILGKHVTNIGVCTLVDFDKLKAMLSEEGVHYYTHTPKAQRPFSTIIRGLSDSFDKEEVLGYMQSLQIRVKIMGLYKLGNDRWLFQLSRESDLRGFKEIRFILHCRVFMEKHAKRDVVQCYNCQRFGHVARNCNMPYRCVKCGDSHGPGNCQVPAKDGNTMETLTTDPITGQAVRRVGLPVRCANCDTEGHTAGSKECPKRLELLRKIAAKRTSGSTGGTSAPRVNGVSYAAAARSAVRSNTVNSSRTASAPGTSEGSHPGNSMSLSSARADFDLIDSDCRRLFGSDLLNCLAWTLTHLF
ncbi:Nucleic-acid-binding protein from transposon X-element [Lucilia cuprina]|nr:Nucleic-acid-binding protein from transposon X-element [Lucilia cuprina]